jgi:virginiamycin A acetyltransferase
MPAPSPDIKHPIAQWRSTAFLKAVVDDPRIEVGDYSYYDDSRGPEHFVARCVRYHFDWIGDRLIIGRFVAIAQGVQFIMNGANHALEGFSTYPFEPIGFGDDDRFSLAGLRLKGDTVVGNDVWIGRDAIILPGVRIGDGAIVGTGAVVSRDVPDYAVVVGNPARVVKRRFDDDTVARLLAIRWWDWPADLIDAHLPLLKGCDLPALERMARRIAGDAVASASDGG